MKKLGIALTLGLVIILLSVAAVSANHIQIVSYDDTGGDHLPDTDGTLGSFIRNGDFNSWTGAWDGPEDCGLVVSDHWCGWGDVKGGWEAHMGPANMIWPWQDVQNAGTSMGLGLFIRHAGNGSGGYYAGVYQPLNIPAADYYFINISESIWYNDDRGTAAYNSIAWYAISDTTSPYDASEWRELDPYTIQCPNSYEICDYAGRDETIWLEPGQYLHLIVGHKFPVFNASTVFILDDVSLVSANADDPNANDPTGYYTWYYDVIANPGYDDKCHWGDLYCIGVVTYVLWDQDAPR